MSNYCLYWDGSGYQLLMLALPTQPQPEDQMQLRPVAAEGVQFVLAPLPQVQTGGMQFLSAPEAQPESQIQLQAVDMEGMQIVSLPITQPQPQQQHTNFHQYPHQNPYQPPHQPPLQTVHQPPLQTVHQSPLQTVHQPPLQTVHQPPHQTAHQPPHQTSHQSPHQTARQPQYLAAHQTPYLTTHQPPYLTAHQPTYLTAHQTPYQTAHQPTHQTAHQPPHQTAHQPHQTAHQPPHQTAHQPPHQTAHQPPHQTAHQQLGCQTFHQHPHQTAYYHVHTKTPLNTHMKQPTNTLTNPPANTLTKPPTNTLSKPPTKTRTKPPTNTLTKPSTNTLTKPFTNTLSKPPTNTIAKISINTHAKLPTNTHTKPPSKTHTTPPTDTLTTPSTFTHANPSTKPPTDTQTKSPTDTQTKSPTDTQTKSPTDTYIEPAPDTHTKPDTSTNTHTTPPTDSPKNLSSGTHTEPFTDTHPKPPINTHIKSPTNTHIKSPTNTHTKLSTNTHMKSYPHQKPHQPPCEYPLLRQVLLSQQRPHQDRQHQPQPRPVAGGKKLTEEVVQFAAVVQPEFQLHSTTSVLPREGEEVLTNSRRQALAKDAFTSRKKKLQRNQTIKNAILHGLRQAQLLQWRRNQNIRSGMENFRRQQHQRHQRFQKGQRPLTQRHQQVIAEVLPLQTFWRKCYVSETQLQENSHQNHVTAVSKVVKSTIADLSDQFPSAHLPDSCALTIAMLKLITESGKNPFALVSFLQKLGIVKDSMLCLKHSEPWVMRLFTKVKRTNMNFMWICYCRNQGKGYCHVRSLFKGTFFEDCRVPVFYKFLVILGLLQRKTYNDIIKEVVVDHTTIYQWRKQCRKYFIRYGKQLRQIGGPGTVVEILKRTYNDWCQAQSRIVVAGTERNTGRTFVTLIPDRSAKTLCSVIVKFVAPGGTVITVQRGEYSPLGGLGYKHKVGCLKSNLSNSQDQNTYMDTIQGKLLCLKRFLKRQSAKVKIEDLLGEFMFYNDCINDEVDPSIKFLALLRAEMKK